MLWRRLQVARRPRCRGTGSPWPRGPVSIWRRCCRPRWCCGRIDNHAVRVDEGLRVNLDTEPVIHADVRLHIRHQGNLCCLGRAILATGDPEGRGALGEDSDARAVSVCQRPHGLPRQETSSQQRTPAKVRCAWLWWPRGTYRCRRRRPWHSNHGPWQSCGWKTIRR